MACLNNYDCKSLYSKEYICIESYQGSDLKVCESCNLPRNINAEDCIQHLISATTEATYALIAESQQGSEEQPYRTLVFLGIGLVLVVTSVISCKYRHKIKDQVKRLFRKGPYVTQEQGDRASNPSATINAEQFVAVQMGTWSNNATVHEPLLISQNRRSETRELSGETSDLSSDETSQTTESVIDIIDSSAIPLAIQEIDKRRKKPVLYETTV